MAPSSLTNGAQQYTLSARTALHTTIDQCVIPSGLFFFYSLLHSISCIQRGDVYFGSVRIRRLLASEIEEDDWPIAGGIHHPAGVEQRVNQSSMCKRASAVGSGPSAVNVLRFERYPTFPRSWAPCPQRGIHGLRAADYGRMAASGLPVVENPSDWRWRFAILQPHGGACNPGLSLGGRCSVSFNIEPFVLNVSERRRTAPVPCSQWLKASHSAQRRWLPQHCRSREADSLASWLCCAKCPGLDRVLDVVRHCNPAQCSQRPLSDAAQWTVTLASRRPLSGPVRTLVYV